MIINYKVLSISRSQDVDEEQKSWQVVIVYGSIVGVWYRHKAWTGPFVIEIEQFQQPVSLPGGRRGIDDNSSSGKWRGVRPIISPNPH